MKILILGGTGYIGTILKKYMSNNNDVIIFQKGTQFYRTDCLTDINNVITFVKTNNVNYIIDLTRSTAKSLVSFYPLIKVIDKNIAYIHLNSYSLIDPNVYDGCKFDKIEILVANKIDTYLKKNNYKYFSFITPQIVNDINNFSVSDMFTVRTNYTYVCQEQIFSNFIFNTIKTKESGIYEIPAVKRKFR